MSLSRITSNIAAGLCAMASFGGAAFAQDYPTAPIQMVIPTTPGGGTDTYGRLVANLAEKELGQEIVVENKPGGSGALGIARVISARPDGYRIGFVWNSPLTTTPHSLTVPYDKDDYRPVISIGYSSYVMCVSPDFPAANAKEFIDELKAHPGKYTYGNDGVGGTMQLAAERIFSKVGVKARSVPFAGAGETARNFLGGHVDIYGGSLPPILPHVKAGRAKCLLLTSATGNPALPEAQGLEALGLANAETVLWWGLLVPAKTPDNIVAKLYEAFSKGAESEEFKSALEKQGANVRVLDGSKTADLISKEYQALGEVAASLGISKSGK
ncbi:Bug family tripartite tricarboxylate transporter substrate binding protein [Terrihabitans sp. B22-R8]|uniref:Bug family tripartite tricarboxylate transporter substrate binding protein n=1 Tax=Terrihabitans sp. B22-R8 TaxID=3425128 RepID=UPI00403D1166